MTHELTKKQFDLIAGLIRSIEPPRTAAYLVLVKGMRPADAAREAGISPQSVTNALKRFRTAHKKICAVYPQK